MNLMIINVRRKVSCYKSPEQGIFQQVTHTLAACLPPLPAPLRKRNGSEGAEVLRHSSTIPNDQSKGGAGARTPLPYVIRGYLSIFQIFKFHVKQFFYYYFFLVCNSLK